MIFDCHTHWGEVFRQRFGSDISEWWETLQRSGITHAVVLPHAGLEDGGLVREDNDAVAAVCHRRAGLVPFCTVNLFRIKTAVAEVERCLSSEAFRGVKFHPWLQGFSLSSFGIDSIVECAAHYGVPVLVHDGTPPFSLPSQAAMLARRHPGATIILGHCGLYEHWREAIDGLRLTTYLWGCVCGPYAAGVRELLRCCDLDRLLWGSDFGYTDHDCVGYRIQAFYGAVPDERQRKAILEDNPRRLFFIA